ncbi:MAG: LacI family DNA-binding transcriptional regulator [Acholeplasmataceae bacterium]
MSTIIDVAKLAGVSIATVSRVVNKSGYVSKVSEEKVNRAIQALGYVPSELARNMLNKKTQLIAMIVPGLFNTFFADIVHHVEQQLYKHHLRMLITNSLSPNGLEIEYLEMLKQRKVDGIIIISDNEIEDLITKSSPVVSFDRHFKHTPFVASDNEAGGRLAAKTLSQAGAKQLLYLGDDAFVSAGHFATEVSKRKLGFINYCEENNISYEALEFPKNTKIDETIKRIIKDRRVDGIFAISDFLAAKIIKEAMKQDVDIPKTLKVIGFDGLDDILNTGLRISSIIQDRKKIAEKIVETLIRKMNGEDVKNTIIPISLKRGDTI